MSLYINLALLKFARMYRPCTNMTYSFCLKSPAPSLIDARAMLHLYKALTTVADGVPVQCEKAQEVESYIPWNTQEMALQYQSM